MLLQCVLISRGFSFSLLSSACCAGVNPRRSVRRSRAGMRRANSFTSNCCNSSRVFPRYLNSFAMVYCFLPVRLGDIFPTFLPGGA